MLLPAYDGDEHRFTIEVPTKGEPGMVVEYERVRRSRINRVHTYLASDTDWLQFAASTTGFHASEVRGTAAAAFSGARGPDLGCRFLACVDPGTDPAMAEEIERMPEEEVRGGVRKGPTTAYKKSELGAVMIPVRPVSWRM